MERDGWMLINNDFPVVHTGFCVLFCTVLYRECASWCIVCLPTSPRPDLLTNSTRLANRTASSCAESPSRISYMPKPGLLHLRYEPTGEMGTLTCSRPAHETCSPSWLTVTSPRLPAGAVSGLPSPVRAHLRNMPALSGQRPSVGVRKHGKLLFGTRLATLNTCQDW